MTRNGKIARLPREIRELVNRRLRDGDQGKVIVEWLSDYPGVLDYMDEYLGAPDHRTKPVRVEAGGIKTGSRNRKHVN